MDELTKSLKGPFNLSIERRQEIQHFHMETQFIHVGFDGKRTGVETYLLKLRCTPSKLTGKGLDEYMCEELSLRIDDGNFTAVPALKDFTYYFDMMSGVNGKGPVFGIPHEIFENITDSKGNAFSPDIRYAIYNNFIDFHSLNDIFSRPMRFGKGIQDLKSVGDRIVHAVAFTEAPVSLGTTIKEGSTFRNGEVALDLKGIGVIDGVTCAVVGYDSGESTVKMIINLGNGLEGVMQGGSEYKGDIYIDLESGWLRKGTIDEFVVTQTGTTNSTAKNDGYTIRHLLLHLTRSEEV